MSIIHKIKKFYIGTKHSLYIAKSFGVKQGLLEWGDTVLLRSRGRLGQKCCKALHENVKAFLLDQYGYLLDEYDNVSGESIAVDSPIWIFWWQGEDKAPDIVRDCINSIKKNAEQHPVIVIDKDNFREYTDIPECLINKVIKGMISFTHFSDVLRMELLYRNGGIWMDATLFAAGKFTQNMTGEIFSVRHEKFSEFHVCKGLWSTFCFAAGKNNSIIKLVRDMLYAYCKTQDSMITYFLIDCIIALCYEHVPNVQQQIEAVPCNNSDVFELLPKLNSPYDENVYKSMRKQTDLFKLSYKNLPNSFSADSFYAKIVASN